ncbi:MAG: putative toxin-antitoxin system toxin component, PIN family, partial [Methanomicrobia archaeon]|nr:putative toxin-antitoxin system toxin component, PIN family [Methanomicrobia archaeon]
RMRIFIDANILISGIVFEGNEREFLKKSISKEIQLVSSEDAINEVSKIIEMKFPEFLDVYRELLVILNIEIIPRKKYKDKIKSYTVIRDKNDRYILASATEGKCEYIVTGDKDLLVLIESENIKIVNARGIMENLTR